MHLYEEKELSAAEAALAQCSASDVSARKIKGLKNEDAVLAVAAAAAGLEVESVRVLSNDTDGDCEEWVLNAMPKKSDLKGFGCVRYLDGGRGKGITDEEVEAWTLATGERLDERKVEWVSARSGARKKFAELEYAPGGVSFGNEACTATFYTRAVLLVDVPAFDEDRAELGTDALTSERVHASKAATPAQSKVIAKAAAPKAAAPVAPKTPAAAAKGSKRKAGAEAAEKAAKAEDEEEVEVAEEDEDEDDTYEVVKIMSSRKGKGGKTEYNIKWKGYDKLADNTWEPARHLNKELIKDFEAALHTGGASSSGATAPPAAAATSAGKAPAAAAQSSSAGAASSSQPAAASFATPSLFAPAKGKAKASAAPSGPRRIEVIGGQGDTRCERVGGKATLVLQPTGGLRELKTAIRKVFGKFASHKLSKLILVKDGVDKGEVKKGDLVEGATVKCTYAYAQGNAANLHGGRRGGFGGGGMNLQMLGMMMVAGYGGGRYSDDSDDYGSDY